MNNPPSHPKTIACVPCWRGIYYSDGDFYTAPPIYRRFFVRYGNDLAVHRLVEEDDHVVKAACGDFFAGAGLPKLDPTA